MATNNAINEPTAESGKVLQGQGVGTTSAFSTATYPSTATGTGTILRADGTNWVASTATYPNTAGTSGNVLTSDGTNWVSSAPAGVSNLFYATGTLTNAQIKALHTTPVQLIAGAGSGKVIHILTTSFKLNYGGTNAFTSGGLSLSYGSGTSNPAVGAAGGSPIAMTQPAIQATSTNYSFCNVTAGTAGASIIVNIASTLMENIGIFIWQVSADPTGNAANNNTISWAISYLVETI